MSAENNKRTAFVVMGFGKKTDFETGRTLDLDKAYRNMIKPAVEKAGLACVRADEINHSGLIDIPMYEQLLKADVVVADLSTSNKNALYELGVRHALRPFTTVVIAEDGIKTFPFDIAHVAVRQYHHLGEDIGFEEVVRFRELLTKAILEILKKNPPAQDSPVYAFLSGLTPPSMQQAVQAAIQTIASGVAANLSNATSISPETPTYSMVIQQVEEAKTRNDFVKAKTLLAACRDKMEASAPGKTDPYVIQQLALVIYKSKVPSEEIALKEARDILVPLEPDTSNDTETLGLWGAVHKRLWGITKDLANLDAAIRAYKRGFFLRNDYYNGINYAYMLNERASNSGDPADAITDFVQARRVRKEVLEICAQWLHQNPIPDASKVSAKAMAQYEGLKYWVLATMVEAYLGLGDTPKQQELLEQANALNPAPWMKETTEKQRESLTRLLGDSPLKHIRA